MSIPTPQFQFDVLSSNKFSWFWVDFIQKVYQSVGKLRETIDFSTDTPFTLILPGETVSKDISINSIDTNDHINLSLQHIDIGLVYQISIINNNTVRVYCSNITGSNIAVTFGKIMILIWSF